MEWLQDKWTDAQVTKVKMGGNAKCRAFFEGSPDYNKNMAIADKVLSIPSHVYP